MCQRLGKSVGVCDLGCLWEPGIMVSVVVRLDCPSLCAEVQGDQLGKFIAVVQEMMMVWKGLKQ